MAFVVNISCDRASATASGSEDIPTVSAKASLLRAALELEGSGSIVEILLWRLILKLSRKCLKKASFRCFESVVHSGYRDSEGGKATKEAYCLAAGSFQFIFSSIVCTRLWSGGFSLMPRGEGQGISALNASLSRMRHSRHSILRIS